MKRLGTLGLALLALFAFGAIAANMAFAEEGLLPTAEFTSTGGAATLVNLNKEKIECTASKSTGKFLTEKDKDTHAEGTFSFEGCKALGFSANTLGEVAGSGIIKANVLYLLCLVESTKLIWGILIQPTEIVHVEVPSLKALILVKGAVIGTLMKGGKPLEGQLEITEAEVSFAEKDEATRMKCSLKELGEWTASYEAAIDTKADVDAFQTGSGTVKFVTAVKFMDT